jgi:hypothetical protein
VTIVVQVSSADVAYVGVGYRNGQVQPSWLGVTSAPACQGRSCTFTLSVLTTDIEPGEYVCNLTIGAADAQGRLLATRDVLVTYSVTGFSVSPGQVVLGGADGLSALSQPFTFSLFAAGSWTYSLDPATATGGGWLRANSRAGTVGYIGTTVDLSADRAGLTGGTYQGTVTLGATVYGTFVTRSIPVVLNLEAKRLVPAARGIGLSSWPGRSVLSRTIAISSSTDRSDIPWSASADQPWLSVTPSGTTGGSLTVVADPSALVAGATYLANVSLNSSDPTIENAPNIRVALTVLAAEPAGVTIATSGITTNAVASPAEPLVFVNHMGTDVTAYDVYSGAVVRTFQGVVAQGSTMTVSQDGTILYVQDLGPSVVKALDATTGSLLQQYSASIMPEPMLVFEPGGAPVLMAPQGYAYDLSSGSALGAGQIQGLYPPATAYSAPPGGSFLATTRDVWSVRFSALNGGSLAFARVATGDVYGADGQGCVNSAGAVAYFASGGIYGFTRVSLTGVPGADLTALAWPDAIVCPWNGLVIGGRDSSFEGPPDVYVYDGATGAPVSQMAASPDDATGRHILQARGLLVSADGTRLISLVYDLSQYPQQVALQTLPTPP